MLRLACLIAALAVLPGSVLAGELVISTGREGGSYDAIGQRLRSAMLLEDEGQLRVVTSEGSRENLERLDSPMSRINLALTQADALKLYLDEKPEFANEFFVLGDVGRECLFLVGRSVEKGGAKGVAELGKNGIGQVVVGDAASGAAVTLALMSRSAPRFASAIPTYEDPMEGLLQLEAGGAFTKVRAVLIVQRPNRLSPPVAQVMGKPAAYGLVSLTEADLPKQALPALPDGSPIYSFERVSLGGKRHKKRIEVDTVCMHGLMLGSKTKLEKEQRRMLSDLMLRSRDHVVGKDE